MDQPSVNQFRAASRKWLEQMRPRKAEVAGGSWGEGSDSVAVFHTVDAAEERALLEAQAAWQKAKLDAGFGAIDVPSELGGSGLTKAHAAAFALEEAGFEVPASTELFRVSLGLIAPAVARFGTDDQKHGILQRLLEGGTWVCQLFSEPGAGSDLASLRCRAERGEDGAWRLTGQKVWTSGAHVAQYGLLIARTDASQRHAGLTAFLVPLDAEGIEVRPIRQMTGGTSFNEVFLDDVHLPDGARLGDVGAGWSVTLAILAFEREVAGETHAHVGGSIERLVQLAQHTFGTHVPHVILNGLADAYIRAKVLDLHNERAAQTGDPIAGSLGKLMWTENLRRVGELASQILGARLTADVGDWGTFCWNEHVLGAPGFRIAGGTDEIQRNIVAERGLGLPREQRP